MTTLDGSTGAAPEAPRQIELDFLGPLSFMPGKSCVFTHPLSRASGVYLWAILQREKNDYLIHYVGETSSLGKRHREHFIHILGLNYGIFDADAAQEGQCDLLWPGLWRSPKDPDAPARMLEAYGNLNREVHRYVATIAIFFAEFHGDPRLRKHLEGCIAKSLRTNILQMPCCTLLTIEPARGSPITVVRFQLVRLDRFADWRPNSNTDPR